MGESISVTHASRPLTCPLCHGALGAEPGADCQGCGARYHRSCLAELGGCATLGCDARGARPDARPRPLGPVPARPLDLRVLATAMGVLVTLLVAVGATVILLDRPDAPVAAPPPPPSPPPPPPPPAPSFTAEEVREARERGTTLLAIDAAAARVHARLALARQVEAVEAGEAPGARDAYAAAIGEEDALPELRRLVRLAVELRTDGDYLRDRVLGRRAPWGLELLVWGDGPSPLGAALDARLQALVTRLDRERERVAAAGEYAAALRAALERERLLSGALDEPALEGPDPHELARAARRRFVAAGGVERPIHSPHLLECDVPVALLAGQVHGVLAADDGTPTPTQRARGR